MLHLLRKKQNQLFHVVWDITDLWWRLLVAFDTCAESGWPDTPGAIQDGRQLPLSPFCRMSGMKAITFFSVLWNVWYEINYLYLSSVECLVKRQFPLSQFREISGMKAILLLWFCGMSCMKKITFISVLWNV